MKLLLKSLLVAMLSMAASKAFAYDACIDGIYYNRVSATELEVTSGNNKYTGSIVIPENVTYAGKTYNVTSIDHRAFAGCRGLTSVVIPKSVKKIYTEAFKDCTSLTAISLPHDVEMWYRVFDGCINLFQKSDSAIVYVTRTVVDTLRAEGIFNTDIKPTLLAEYEKGVAKQRRIKELQSMEQKKVKTPEDLNLLKLSYIKYMVKEYMVMAKDYDAKDKNYKIDFRTEGFQFVKQSIYIVEISRKDENGRCVVRNESFWGDKNVEKGKLTPEVRQYLAYYYEYLTDSLKTEHDIIDRGWTEWIDNEKRPLKEITIPIRNSFYRGSFWYFEYIGMNEEMQQKKGWNFLYTEDGKYHHDSYPVKIGYYVYDSYPNYRVIRNEDKIKGVYDSQGNLVYIPLLKRYQSDEFISIKRLVYLRDYLKNKYEIHSQPEETQEYIKYELSKDFESADDGSDLFSSMFAAALIGAAADELLSPVDAHKVKNEAKDYAIKSLPHKTKPRWNRAGDNYIEQLEKDHADEFGYVYMIERLSNVSFRVVYLNKQTLEPSYCAVITYRTGEEPYTAKFSTKLVDMPSDIPPVIHE